MNTLDLYVECSANGMDVCMLNNAATVTARGNLRNAHGAIFHARVLRTATENGDGTFQLDRWFPGYRGAVVVEEQADYEAAVEFLVNDEYTESLDEIYNDEPGVL